MDDKLGERCSSVGLTGTNLQYKVKDMSLSNGMVLEIAKNLPARKVSEILNIQESSVRSRIRAMKKKVSLLLRSINKVGGRKQLEEYLDETFVLPRKRLEKEKLDVKPSCQNCVDLIAANEEIKERNKDNLTKLEKGWQNKVTTLEQNLRVIKCKRRKERRQLKNAKGQLTRMFDSIGSVPDRKNILRKLRVLKDSRYRWRQDFNKLKRKHENLKAQFERRKKKERCRILRLHRRVRKSSMTNSTPIRKSAPVEEANISFVNELIKENDILQNRIELLESPIQTMQGNHFAPNIREASYYLQNLGVAEGKCSEAIRQIAECLFGHEIRRLPSRSTQGRMASEMKALSRKQVREHVALSDGPVTLKYDGTTKGRLGHLAEVEISTADKTFVTGIRQQVGGSASEYVQSIKDSCQDINNDLLHSIENTMTDRCVTNAAIDKTLEDVTGKKLNSFRCAMHPLDTFAKESVAILKKLDTADQPKESKKLPFRKECNAQALIRAASKLFNSEGCGETTTLSEFLKERGVNQRMPRFVGNRFGILFHSATILFSIGNHIIDYFRTVQKPTNDLHRAFVNAWTADRLEHLRCLGLIDQLITGPWMRLIGNNPNILEMNERYNHAKTTLECWIADPGRMLNEGKSIFGDTIHEVENSLTCINENEKEDVEKVIKELLNGILGVFSRQLSSQLPGGQFWDPSTELRNSAKSCVAHNISGERNFAIVDAQLKKAPNISIGKVESKVMFQGNKTRDWLKSKRKGDKEEIILESINLGSEERRSEKRRKHGYLESVKKRLREKQTKLSDKEKRERSRTEEIIDVVIDHGLWKERENIEAKLNHMSKTQQRDVLRKQVLFRTMILSSDLGKFAITKASTEELVALLVQNRIPSDDGIVTIVESPESIIGKEFHHKWEDVGEVWYCGHLLHIDDGEYGMKYENNPDVFYMTISKFLTDLHLGDISFDA